MTLRNLGICGLLAVCGMLASPTLGIAQTFSAPPMQHIDLRTAAMGHEDLVATWSDRIAETNRAWARNTGRPLAPGANAPSDILWQTFNQDGTQITASIFFGEGCDGGANSKDNEQGWSVCPARVTVSGPAGRRVVQTQACYQYFPIADGQEPPEGNRSYAIADAVTGTVAFSATQDGRVVASCNRRVKIPR